MMHENVIQKCSIDNKKMLSITSVAYILFTHHIRSAPAQVDIISIGT